MIIMIGRIYAPLFTLLANCFTLNTQSDLIVKLPDNLTHAYDSAKFARYMAIGKAYYPDNLPKAHQYVDSAFLLAKKNGNWKGMGLAEERQGLLYKASGNFEAAETHLNNSFNIFYEHQFYSNAAWAKRNLGTVNTEKGDFVGAMRHYTEASRLAEKTGNKKALAFALRGISFIYIHYDEPKKSLENASKAYLTLQETNYDTLDLADVLHTLGVALKESNQLDSAISCYELAASYNKVFNEMRSVAGNLNNIALIYEEQGRYRKALKYYLQTLQIDRQYGDSLGLTYSHIGPANVYFKLNNFDSALHHAQNSFRIAQSIKALQRIQKAGESLTNIYRARKKYDSALYYYDIVAKVKDSLFQQAKFRVAQELQTKYDIEKKEQALVSLQKEKETVEFRRNVYAILGGLILILAFLIYNRQRLKSRKDRQLLEKEKEVDRMKSRFFTNISHEFRTPLTLILGPIETLKSRVKDQQQVKQLNVMQKNATRLLDLINQLLDLSKLESGKLKLAVAKGNIVPVIKGIAMSFHSLAESKQIALNVTADEEGIELYFDQDKIEKIFTNLLSNAFKFTPENGRINVTINTVNQANGRDTGDTLSVKVLDSGKGIAPDNIDHIFDRFYQPEDQTVETDGSGIGLALAKELTELHGGKIIIRSRINEGTECTVLLPMGKNHLKETDIAPAKIKNDRGFIKPENLAGLAVEPESPAENAGGLQETKTLVLLIEDNDDVRAYIKQTLGDRHIVLEAANGAEGLATAKMHIPDLIVSDIMMPGMDGYQVCENLKQDEKTSHIPVILLTAKASVENRIEGFESQADGYLSKPFLPRELAARIDNLIESRKKLREKYNRQVVLKPGEITINSVDEAFLERLMKVVENHLSDEHFNVEQLGREVGMSRSQIHRKLRALTNQSATQFVRSIRLQRAMEMIRKNAGTISEIAYSVGFGSPSYFNKCFLRQFGFRPSQVNEGQS